MDNQELLDKVKNFSPRSNPETLREFVTGSIHEDFRNEITSRIEQMRDFNEGCKSNEYLETRGGIKALRLTQTIFEDILNMRIADLESEQQGDE